MTVCNDTTVSKIHILKKYLNRPALIRIEYSFLPKKIIIIAKTGIVPLFKRGFELDAISNMRV